MDNLHNFQTPMGGGGVQNLSRNAFYTDTEYEKNARGFFRGGTPKRL